MAEIIWYHMRLLPVPFLWIDHYSYGKFLLYALYSVISLEFQFQQHNYLEPTLGFSENAQSNNAALERVTMPPGDQGSFVEATMDHSSQLSCPMLNVAKSTFQISHRSAFTVVKPRAPAENGFRPEVSYADHSL